MNRIVVKICGITRLEDALLAARLGARRIGFVFAPSPRRISVSQAASIAAQLPADVTPVGVFVDASKEDVESAFEQKAIGIAQFHGNETPEFCHGFTKPWIKAIRVAVESDLDVGLNYENTEILVDARVDGVYGGTGKSLSDQVLTAAFRDRSKKRIVAGGLGPTNIGTVLTTIWQTGVLPYGIDAASALESKPGVKDPQKLRRFFEEIVRFTSSHSQNGRGIRGGESG